LQSDGDDSKSGHGPKSPVKASEEKNGNVPIGPGLLKKRAPAETSPKQSQNENNSNNLNSRKTPPKKKWGFSLHQTEAKGN